jgi:hypothetical protein
MGYDVHDDDEVCVEALENRQIRFPKSIEELTNTMTMR